MLTRIRHTRIRDVKLIEPKISSDARGLRFDSFDQEWFEEHVARGYRFVQDRHFVFSENTLTGLHYQISDPQGTILRVVNGEIFAVALDLRRWSVTYGRWVGEEISATNSHQMWIPPGFAYGFSVRSSVAEVLMKVTGKCNPTLERTICWNDPELGIDWGLSAEPVATSTIANCVSFNAIEPY